MTKFILTILAMGCLLELGYIGYRLTEIDGLITVTPYSVENVERVRAATIPDYIPKTIPTTKVIPPTVKPKSKVVVPENQVMCMQFNIYHESRGEPIQGQIGTGWVTINRIKHSGFGSSPCEVVYAAVHDSRGNPVIGKCQFEWYCDGKSDVPDLSNKFELEAWEQAGELARYLLEHCVVTETSNCPPDPTNGALFFRGKGITLTDPYYIPTAHIGEHRYYAIR